MSSDGTNMSCRLIERRRRRAMRTQGHAHAGEHKVDQCCFVMKKMISTKEKQPSSFILCGLEQLSFK